MRKKEEKKDFLDIKYISIWKETTNSFLKLDDKGHAHNFDPYST